MKLYWIKYSKSGAASHRLVVVLGTYNGKLCCLDANAMDDSDKEAIRDRSAYLDKLSIEDKVATIKILCPGAMRHYKTINLSNLSIDKEYDIKPR